MEEIKMDNERLKSEIKVYKLKALKEKIVLFGVMLLVLAEILALLIVFKKTVLPKTAVTKPYIAVININKTITVAYINALTNTMNKLKKDKHCKEYLLIFNTPGGSPSASDEFNAYLRYINKIKKVNVYVESMAASGGYYIISAIKPIIANKNAVVGSIGVIMPHFVLKKLADKIGVSEDSLTMGKYKEPVSFFKKFSPQDKKYLINHLLLPTYENFIKTVSKDRNIPVNTVKKYADGKVYIANQVKGILVDKISNLITLKENIKKKYHGNIKFVNISPEKKKIAFFNIKLSSEFGNALNKAMQFFK